MTIQADLAGYILALERRVDRLKTLEHVPQAAGGSWTFIDETELAVAAASIIFTSIPQTYDDLMVIWRARSAKTTGFAPFYDWIIAQFNGDTTLGNYDSDYTSQSSGGTCRKDNGYVDVGICHDADATGNADTFATGMWFLPMYAGTSYKKTGEGWSAVMGITGAAGLNAQSVGCWSITPEAINEIKFYLLSAANYLADTKFELYGLTR